MSPELQLYAYAKNSGNLTRISGQQLSIWEGDSIDLLLNYFGANAGVLITLAANQPDQFSQLPAPYSSPLTSAPGIEFKLTTKENTIRDGDRSIALRLLEERSSSTIDFSLLIKDDDFGLTGPAAGQGSTSGSSTGSASNRTTNNTDGTTIVRGNGNTVNISTTVINNITNIAINNTVNDTVNNHNFTLFPQIVNMANAIEGTSRKADIVAGTISDDVIAFGLGKDRLTGNGGTDTFVLDTADRLNKKGADIITDFDPASGDNLVIDPSTFAGSEFGRALNTKQLKEFKKEDFDFIYNAANGKLFHNENGSKQGLGNGGLLSILLGAPELNQESLGLLA